MQEQQEQQEQQQEQEQQEQQEEDELDDNLKDFIVLCTHKHLYKQEIPSLSSNKRVQKSMEKIISRHVDSICEAFKYLS